MSHRITDWDPEDVVAWEAGNKNIAHRNLCRNVASCETPITECSLSRSTTCEPFTTSERAAGTWAWSAQVLL